MWSFLRAPAGPGPPGEVAQDRTFLLDHRAGHTLVKQRKGEGPARLKAGAEAWRYVRL